MIVLHHALTEYLRVLQSLKLVSRNIALLQQLLVKRDITLLRNWCVLNPCVIWLCNAFLFLYYTWDIPLTWIKTHRGTLTLFFVIIILSLERRMSWNHFVFLIKLSFRRKLSFEMTRKISVKTDVILSFLVFSVCVEERYVRAVQDYILI
jgi:hypothetical protein